MMSECSGGNGEVGAQASLDLRRLVDPAPSALVSWRQRKETHMSPFAVRTKPVWGRFGFLATTSSSSS